MALSKRLTTMQNAKQNNQRYWCEAQINNTKISFPITIIAKPFTKNGSTFSFQWIKVTFHYLHGGLKADTSFSFYVGSFYFNYNYSLWT